MGLRARLMAPGMDSVAFLIGGAKEEAVSSKLPTLRNPAPTNRRSSEAEVPFLSHRLRLQSAPGIAPLFVQNEL